MAETAELCYETCIRVLGPVGMLCFVEYKFFRI
jgi:hypothetical protein